MRNRITSKKSQLAVFILLTTQSALTWVWEGGKPFRPYTPINASFWREILNLRNCGWSIKSCDLQKIPGGTSWIALRPISSSPESMLLFSCVNPPNFPECKRFIDEGWKKRNRFPFKKSILLLNAHSAASWWIKCFHIFFPLKAFIVRFLFASSKLAYCFKIFKSKSFHFPQGMSITEAVFTPTVFLDHLKHNYLTNYISCYFFGEIKSGTYQLFETYHNNLKCKLGQHGLWGF